MAKPRGVRSPNYPVISLKDAVSRVQLLYKTEFTHLCNRGVIALAIGYTSLNGASASVISAIAKYGLLENVGDEYRVSPLAVDILLHHRGESERVEAVREAAFTPALFNELRATYGDKPPSNHSLEVYLIKHGFNPSAVANAIRSYRETLEFVNQETAGLTSQLVEEESEEEQSGQMLMSPQSVRQRENALDARAVERSSPSYWDASPVVQQGRVLTFNVAEDCDVQVIFRGRVTQDAIETFIEYLQVSKKTYPKGEAIKPGSPFYDELGDTK
jgi:hypothetical protein